MLAYVVPCGYSIPPLPLAIHPSFLLLIKPVCGENRRMEERGSRPSEVKGLRFAPIPSFAITTEGTSALDFIHPFCHKAIIRSFSERPDFLFFPLYCVPRIPRQSTFGNSPLCFFASSLRNKRQTASQGLCPVLLSRHGLSGCTFGAQARLKHCSWAPESGLRCL
jgi:hypothetical protein